MPNAPTAPLPLPLPAPGHAPLAVHAGRLVTILDALPPPATCLDSPMLGVVVRAAELPGLVELGAVPAHDMTVDLAGMLAALRPRSSPLRCRPDAGGADDDEGDGADAPAPGRIRPQGRARALRRDAGRAE